MNQANSKSHDGAARQITFHWTSQHPHGHHADASKPDGLRVSCASEPRRRTASWCPPSGKSESSGAAVTRPGSASCQSTKTSPSRVRFIYEDEATRARVCDNAQRLIDTVQQDPQAVTTSAQVALKALKYRRLMGRLDGVDAEDPNFDVSAFLGIEWCRAVESVESAPAAD